MTTQTERPTRPEGPDPQPGAAPARSATTGAWLLVARREVIVKLTDRAFLIGTILTLAVIAGAIGAQALFSGRTHTYEMAASSPEAVSMAERIADGAADLDDSVRVKVVPATGNDAARSAVDSEDADVWLHPSGDGWTLTSRTETDAKLKQVVTTVVREAALDRNATEAGTTAEALERGGSLEVDQLEGDAQRSQLADIMGFAFVFLFYLATVMFGITLATSVVEEKQSRIVEMIAAAIPVRQLLAGKVVGNTVLALGQLALFVAVGLIGLAFTDFSSLLSGVTGAVGWFVLFFLAGFVALSCLWAVAGALASRNDDLQATTTPVTMLVMAMFFGGIFLNGAAQTVVSFVPPVSAVLMPVRILEGGVAWWEPVLAMVLLIAFAAALIAVGERVYRRALLQTGGRISMKEAWRLEE